VCWLVHTPLVILYLNVVIINFHRWIFDAVIAKEVAGSNPVAP
jgi:bacteriorhodopsin